MELQVSNSMQENQHERLVKAISLDPSSHLGPETYTLQQEEENASTILTSLQISHLTAVRNIPTNGTIIGPVTLPEDEEAVRRWLTARGHDASNLADCKAMCEAVGESASQRFFRRFITFVAAARRYGVPEDDLPDEVDFFMGRAWPRVLATIASVARVVDAHGWVQAGGWDADLEMNASVSNDGSASIASNDSPASIPPFLYANNKASTWTKRIVNERWSGDDIVREIMSVIKQDCCIVVAGSQGGGKSATIDMLMGRPCMPHSHVLTYTTPRSEQTEREREDWRKYQYLVSLHGRKLPVEMNMPTASNTVDRVFAKLDGHMLKFVEIPCLETAMDSYDDLGKMHMTQHGVMRDVIETLQRDYADVVLLVDRLDAIDEERFLRSLRNVRKIYGSTAMERMIVVLTHGASFPPAGLSYKVWVYDRLRVVREVCRKSGCEKVQVPILILENSVERVDESQSPFDRRRFRTEFLEAYQRIIAKRMVSGPLDPVPTKRWWENYIVMLGAAFLITRIR